MQTKFRQTRVRQPSARVFPLWMWWRVIKKDAQLDPTNVGSGGQSNHVYCPNGRTPAGGTAAPMRPQMTGGTTAPPWVAPPACPQGPIRARVAIYRSTT